MIHFHATQKLLNTSRIKPVLYISEPLPGQRMHNWYVALCGSGFSGKMLLLYIHEPSLLTVVVKGKTISSTIDTFRSQLEQLLHRENFPSDFITTELGYSAEYVVGKTSDKSMLGHINHMISHITIYNLRFASYDAIDTIVHEDLFMNWLSKTKGQKNYQTPRGYWVKELGFTI